MPEKRNNHKDLPAGAGKKIIVKGAREQNLKEPHF